MLLAPQAYYTLSKKDFIHTFILVTLLFNCSLVMIKFHSAFLVHADLGKMQIYSKNFPCDIFDGVQNKRPFWAHSLLLHKAR